ncbi:uncharacterized protein [Magallana gigas]|uniref:uncharacterized protein n=1 Tax=Magallana gigas TaxID=29159 RepID=UPI0033420D71
MHLFSVLLFIGSFSVLGGLLASQTDIHMLTRSHPGFIEVVLSPHQSVLTIESQIMGTGYRSAFDMDQNQTRLIIDTDEHPGFYIISLIQNGTILTTRYINAVCQKQTQLDLNQTYVIQSPEFPLSYHAGMRCSWNITKSTQNTWFKMSALELGNNCLTSFQMDFKDKLCSKTRENKSLLVTDDSVFLTFSSLRPGEPSSLLVEVVPEIPSPANLTAVSHGNSMTLTWDWSGPEYDDLLCVIEYAVYPSAVPSTIKRNCSDTPYTLDTSMHRGQLYQIRIFSETLFWESEKTDYVNLTSECHLEVFISSGNETNIFSDGYPNHLQPFSNCSWKINTDYESYLKVQIHDLNFCYNPIGCRSTCLHIDDKNICSRSPKKKEYLLQNNSTLITFNTTNEIGGRGFNLSIKAVDSPPPFGENFQLHSEQGFINVSWQPYSGSKRLLRYVNTYRIVPEVAYHVKPIHVNTTHYVINTRSHLGQLFALRLSYLTEGGEGTPSGVKIIRAVCGYTTFLHHNQSLTFSSPELSGNYLSNVYCKWTILNNQSLWYKINFIKMDVENSIMCQKDYVEFSANQKYCGNRTGSFVIRNSKAVIAFVTDDSNSGTGFSGTITALYPPSSKPTNPSISKTQYGLLVKWTEPLVNPGPVRGYRVSYKHADRPLVSVIIVSANENAAFINTRSYPGSLYEVWISAIGETEDSKETNHMYSYSECGSRLRVSNTTEYISTPFYPEFPEVTHLCSWIVSSDHDYTLTIKEVHKTNFSTNSRDQDYLMVNDIKYLISNVTRGMKLSFYGKNTLSILMRVGKTSVLTEIRPING